MLPVLRLTGPRRADRRLSDCPPPPEVRRCRAQISQFGNGLSV